ncbi:hypothetical protein D3C72_2572290 [compost metagenome]
MPTARPMTGRTAKAAPPPMMRPMPTPTAARAATWAKKWMKMRDRPAPMERRMAMTLARSAI